MTGRAACATSLHGAGCGRGKVPSLFRRLRFLSWVAEAGRFHSQTDPGRLPLVSPSVHLPFPCFWGISEGPVQQSRQAQRGGPLLAPVPVTATAWQQRAPSTVAINNPPEAATVRQPAALGGKCGALSAPARGAPTALSGEHSKYQRVLFNCLAYAEILRQENNNSQNPNKQKEL
ncbi:hypothetical protein NN561_010419 [Cricetulus griseus]